MGNDENGDGLLRTWLFPVRFSFPVQVAGKYEGGPFGAVWAWPVTEGAARQVQAGFAAVSLFTDSSFSDPWKSNDSHIPGDRAYVRHAVETEATVYIAAVWLSTSADPS